METTTMNAFRLMTLALAMTACGGDDTDTKPFVDAQAPSPAVNRCERDLNLCRVNEDGDPFCYLDYGNFDGDARDTCAGNDVCDTSLNEVEGGGFCVEEYLADVWTFYLIALELPERDANGDCWDAGCGAPDPLITLYVNGEDLGSAGPFENLFSIQVPPGTGLPLGHAWMREYDEVVIEVRDSDLSRDDAMLGCGLDIEAGTLKRRIFTCTYDSGAKVVFLARLTPEADRN